VALSPSPHFTLPHCRADLLDWDSSCVLAWGAVGVAYSVLLQRTLTGSRWVSVDRTAACPIPRPRTAHLTQNSPLNRRCAIMDSNCGIVVGVVSLSIVVIHLIVIQGAMGIIAQLYWFGHQILRHFRVRLHKQIGEAVCSVEFVRSSVVIDGNETLSVRETAPGFFVKLPCGDVVVCTACHTGYHGDPSVTGRVSPIIKVGPTSPSNAEVALASSGLWPTDNIQEIVKQCHVAFFMISEDALKAFHDHGVKPLTLPSRDLEISVGDHYITRSRPFGGRLITKYQPGDGLEFSGHEGLVCAVRRQVCDGSSQPKCIDATYMVEGTVLEGSSGSPLCTRGGEVFGVITHRVSKNYRDVPTNLGCAVSLRSFYDLLNEDDPCATFKDQMGCRFVGSGDDDSRLPMGSGTVSLKKNSPQEVIDWLETCGVDLESTQQVGQSTVFMCMPTMTVRRKNNFCYSRTPQDWVHILSREFFNAFDSSHTNQMDDVGQQRAQALRRSLIDGDSGMDSFFNLTFKKKMTHWGITLARLRRRGHDNYTNAMYVAIDAANFSFTKNVLKEEETNDKNENITHTEKFGLLVLYSIICRGDFEFVDVVFLIGFSHLPKPQKMPCKNACMIDIEWFKNELMLKKPKIDSRINYEAWMP
jgi:hypothetical protein